MTALSGSIQFYGKTAAQWASDNTVLLVNQPGKESDTGQLKIGDGVTAWNSLPYVGSNTSTSSRIISGGVITVGTYDGTGTNNDIRVTASTFYISGNGSYSAAQTDFLNISLSSAGTQRYIGLYGTTSNTISKVEGSEAALATLPSTPANTVLIGYVLVSDAAVTTTPDLSGYLLVANKATKAEAQAATNDTKYLTPLASVGVRLPRTGSVASSATPSIDITLYDCYNVTALATSVTAVTITGTPVDFQPLIIDVVDNGVTRSVTLGSQFYDQGGGVTFSTTASKHTKVAALYSSSKGKWGVVRIITEV